MYAHPRHPDLACWSILCIHIDRFHRVQCPTILGTIDDLAYDSILSIQMRLLCVRDKELRLVGIRTRICTRDDSTTIESERRSDLIRERLAPDRLSSFAGPCRITGLDHERFDVAMPFDVVVGARGAVTEEVLGCAGGDVAEHFDLQVAEVGVQRDRHGCAVPRWSTLERGKQGREEQEEDREAPSGSDPTSATFFFFGHSSTFGGKCEAA